MRVGIITIDSSLAAQLRSDLKELGFTTAGEGNGADTPEVILLDCRASVPEPRGSGDYENPVIAVIESRNDKSLDFLADFDDVLFFPYTKEELFVRVYLTNRRRKNGGASETFEWRGFKIDFSSYEVTTEGVKLDLTYKEFELLKCLASSPGRVFTRSQLLKIVWGYDYIEGARTVDVHIRRLRSKLGVKYGALIETVRHVGYRLTSDAAAKPQHVSLKDM